MRKLIDDAVKSVLAEAKAAAVMLGFKPNAKIIEAVEQDEEWWSETQDAEFMDTKDYKRGVSPKDPEWARVACLNSITYLWQSWVKYDDSDFELSDTSLKILRGALPYGSRELPDISAEWTQERHAGERIEQLKRELEMAEKELSRCRCRQAD